MKHSPVRRALLRAAAAVPISGACIAWAGSARAGTAEQGRLGALESAAGGRLGVAAFNTATGAQISHRAEERFPSCSTFKVLAVSAVLKRSAAESGLLQRLALGDALGETERDRLLEWMRGNTTGATRIRAGVPAGWQVADKTGSGGYGTVNDVAVVWPPGKPPVVLAIYFTQPDNDAPSRNDVVATAAQIAAEALVRASPRHRMLTATSNPFANSDASDKVDCAGFGAA